MAIQGLTGYDNAAASSQVERSEKEGKGQAPEKVVSEFDHVQISVEAQQLELYKGVASDTLDDIEKVLDASYKKLMDQAGKSDYLKSIENPTDLSSEATAGRILGGITGYIYAAFRLQHPEATEEELQKFEKDVYKGFDQGLGDAKGMIEGLGAMNDKLAVDIDKTEALVRKGLAEFFDKLFGRNQEEASEPAVG